jgi:hypothetical protein
MRKVIRRRQARCEGCQQAESVIVEMMAAAGQDRASIEAVVSEAIELVAEARRLIRGGDEPWEPVILTGGDEPDLIAVTEADRYRPLLACGHWGPDVAPDSGLWACPMGVERCLECQDDRYLDTRLQARLLNWDEVPAGYEAQR